MPSRIIVTSTNIANSSPKSLPKVGISRESLPGRPGVSSWMQGYIIGRGTAAHLALCNCRPGLHTTHLCMSRWPSQSWWQDDLLEGDAEVDVDYSGGACVDQDVVAVPVTQTNQVAYTLHTHHMKSQTKPLLRRMSCDAMQNTWQHQASQHTCFASQQNTALDGKRQLSCLLLKGD